MTNEYFETGIFHRRNDAEEAVARLYALGYTKSDLSVMMRDDVRAREFAADTDSNAAEGTGAGAVIGGGLGVIVASVATMAGATAVISTGGLATPFIVGPLAAVLAGLSGGVVAGGIVGGLIGAGIPREQAEHYQEQLNSGGILLGVNARPEDRDEVRDILASRRTVTSPDLA
jgi:hypothetical protein